MQASSELVGITMDLFLVCVLIAAAVTVAGCVFAAFVSRTAPTIPGAGRIDRIAVTGAGMWVARMVARPPRTFRQYDRLVAKVVQSAAAAQAWAPEVRVRGSRFRWG